MPWGDQSQNKYLRKASEKAMEPRINDPLYNEVLGIMNDFLTDPVRVENNPNTKKPC